MEYLLKAEAPGVLTDLGCESGRRIYYISFVSFSGKAWKQSGEGAFLADRSCVCRRGALPWSPLFAFIMKCVKEPNEVWADSSSPCMARLLAVRSLWILAGEVLCVVSKGPSLRDWWGDCRRVKSMLWCATVRGCCHARMHESSCAASHGSCVSWLLSHAIAIFP